MAASRDAYVFGQAHLRIANDGVAAAEPPRDAQGNCVLSVSSAEVFSPYANSTRVNLSRLHRVRRQVGWLRCPPRRRVSQHRLSMGCSQLGGVREGRRWRDETSSSLNDARSLSIQIQKTSES
jgi:hypothetical protein